MRPRTYRIVIAAAAAYHLVLFMILTVNSTAWIGRTFPGFFVISNRVVASISLPDWADGRAAELFQHQVLAVDGAPAVSADAIYDAVAARPPGTRITYTLRAPNGDVSVTTVPSRVFGPRDYVLLFVAFLVNAAAFLIAGLLVTSLAPSSPAGYGLLGTGLAMGVYFSTAVDLYGPHWFVRLHIAAEAFLTPAVIHLALVFPRERLRRARRYILPALYLPFVVFTIVYELVLYVPSAYTTAHLAASGFVGVGWVLLLGCVVYDLVTSRSALVRRRVGLVGLGTLGAFIVPGAVMVGSVAFGGTVPVNVAAFTTILFPLTLGYAIVARDLFEIDVLLRRAATYAMVVVAIAGLYVLALTVLGRLVPGISPGGHSPLTLAALNVALLFLIAPLQARVQTTVDRFFFRKRYDTDLAVSELSQTLVSAHTLDDVFARTAEVLGYTLCPSTLALYQWRDGGELRRIAARGPFPATVTLPADLAERCARREVLARYEWDDDSGRPVPAIWQTLPADLLLPIVRGAAPLAIVVLGPSESGRSYAAHDVTFLRAAASQVALAMTNASAFAQLEAWNARLEQQVEERTAALEAANAELGRSVRDVRAAYRQLEEKQASLIRSDRLATLGRLTAGIAHEVNTPLGAVVSTLSVIRHLADEYAESIDDAQVTPADHRQIAHELAEQAQAAAGWARKAAAFLNRVRVHARESAPGTAGTFRVRAVVEETEALLAHRLRGSSCTIAFEDDGDVGLVGDATRLGQVIVNLVANAIDAYEDRAILDGRIEIRARRDDTGATLTVRDRAGGIPADLLPRIFDEMFTTKEPGRGTGIGLCIARNLVEQDFGGTLTVEVDPGVGTCFTIAVPAEHLARAAGDELRDAG